MDDKWLEKKIEKLCKLDYYKRPEKQKDIDNIIKMDSNENLVLDKNFIKEIAIQSAERTDLREYPIEQYEQIYEKLAKYTKVDKESIAIGNGSDQIIDLILSVLGKNKTAIAFTPTFSYFINRCDLYEIKINKINLNENNNIEKKLFFEGIKKSNIVYLCSPNNPTGNQLEKDLVIEIMDSFKEKLIIIDEAYVEFANYSLVYESLQRNNVIVLRTFSKALGMAGARIGYLIANKKFSETFRSVIQSPYPVNSLSLSIACKVLEKNNIIEESIRQIKNERQRIFEILKQNKKIKIFPSDANFLFMQILNITHYNTILNELRNKKIMIKPLGEINKKTGHIRFTIGTREMNNKFIDLINNILK